MKSLAIFALGAGLGVAATLGFNTLHHDNGNPYAGQQAARTVTSLSKRDLDELRAGKGWGLAKPAEFNGYPGPRHVLDAAAELNLRPEQRTAIEAAFTDMSRKAKMIGVKYIAAETALDRAFRERSINQKRLTDLITRAQTLRGELRLVHLNAHLRITPLMSDGQKKKYVQLRGYGSGTHHGH